MSDNFLDFVNNLKKCDVCKEKLGFKPNPVFWGNENSKIMQIRQAPSASVNNSLKPFTDQSGNRLKYKWYEITDDIFYNPDNFYITSLAHCYPGKNANGNDKNPPKICYEKWVKKEIQYVNNKLYIIIGAKAAKTFFPNENFDDLIFKINTLNNKMAIVLPHPSPLNIYWFKTHPEFMEKRIVEIRKIIYEVLSLK